MAKGIKHIIFDIGNVVLEWQPEHLLRSVFTVSDYEDLLKKTFSSRLWLAYDSGVITTKELKEQMAFELNTSVTSIEALLQQMVISLRPFPEVVELLQDLKAKGYKLYALTNMPADIFRPLFETYSFWHLFDDIIVSAQIKIAKPDPKVFEFVLNKNNIDADECLFLDDTQVNVDEAKKTGIQTIKVINYQQAIDDLKDVLAF